MEDSDPAVRSLSDFDLGLGEMATPVGGIQLKDCVVVRNRVVIGHSSLRFHTENIQEIHFLQKRPPSREGIARRDAKSFRDLSQEALS